MGTPLERGTAHNCYTSSLYRSTLYHTQLTSYLTHPITDTENGEGGSVRQAKEANVRLLPVDERRGQGRCQEEEPRREHHGGEQGVRGHVGQDRRAHQDQVRNQGPGGQEVLRQGVQSLAGQRRRGAAQAGQERQERQEGQQRQGGRGSQESCRPQESCQGEEESGDIGG